MMNVLLAKEFATPFGIPPFAAIAASHFREAFDAGFARHDEELAGLLDGLKDEPATFENTIVPYEQTGELLERTNLIFSNLDASNTDDELQAIARDYAPKLAAHYLRFMLNTTLFDRVCKVQDNHAKGVAPLEKDQARLVETLKQDMVRSGVRLGEAEKKRMKEISERQATLENQFSQNVLRDEKNWKLRLDPTKGDLVGLPDFLVESMAEAVEEQQQKVYHVRLSRSMVEPFLTYSPRRDLRRIVFQAFITRGDHPVVADAGAASTAPTMRNVDIIRELIALRTEEAHLLGYNSYSDFKLEKSMARTKGAVDALLSKIWEPAKEKARREKELLQAESDRDPYNEAGGRVPVEGSDWRYYAEKVRKAKYDVNEEELKQYFELGNMVKMLFYTAEQLFGVEYVECGQAGVTVYHPDVKVYEVRDKTKGGAVIGIFLHDNFARPNKRSGAWMSEYRRQHGGKIPIVVNNNNFAKGSPVTLLSFDDVKTLFHEAGHGLHGLLSQTRYKSQSGTAVLSDFLEFPSQMMEHWMSTPELLSRFACHYVTGQTIPPALLSRLEAALSFNKGFETVEYVGSLLLDLEYHSLPYAQTSSAAFATQFDPLVFEQQLTEKIGMPAEVGLRHRSVHFQHLFSGSSYASNYYVYIWAQILDADGFAAFRESGDIFNKELAAKLKYVYSAGDSRHPLELFRHFRGAEPSVEPLLKKLGLVQR